MRHPASIINNPITTKTAVDKNSKGEYSLI